jgi:hypothetical protein
MSSSGPTTIPRMTDDELREFVIAFCDQRVFTTAHVRENETDMLDMIFLPLGLGALAGLPESEQSNLGCLWEYLSAAGPRAVNGYPIFMSMRIMHIEDWDRARKAIMRESERRQAIEV